MRRLGNLDIRNRGDVHGPDARLEIVELGSGLTSELTIAVMKGLNERTYNYARLFTRAPEVEQAGRRLVTSVLDHIRDGRSIHTGPIIQMVDRLREVLEEGFNEAL